VLPHRCAALRRRRPARCCRAIARHRTPPHNHAIATCRTKKAPGHHDSSRASLTV